MSDILETLVIIVGALSMMFSAFVIITYAMFWQMREKRFMQFIFYMSLSDFLMNISTCMGFPNNNVVCFIQGVILNIFSMSSWLWTAALSLTVFFTICKYQTFSNRFYHILCWGVPVFTTFIQLTSGTYSIPTPRDTWCVFIAGSHTSKTIELFFNFGFYWCWLMLAVLIMIVCEVIVVWKLHVAQDCDSATFAIAQKMHQKVMGYPIAMIGCWIITLLVNEFPKNESNLTAFWGMISGALNGVLTAIIFFIRSEEARSRWKQWWRPADYDVSLLTVDFPIDFEEDEVYFSPEGIRPSTSASNRTSEFPLGLAHNHIKSTHSVVSLSSLSSVPKHLSPDGLYNSKL